MRIALLMGGNAFQIYCANFLFRKGLIGLVVLEKGNPSAKKASKLTRGSVFGKVRERFPTIRKHPLSVLNYAKYFFKKRLYYGSQAYHNERILGNGYKRLAVDLARVIVHDINSQEVVKTLQDFMPDLVLVFGTRLIKSDLFDRHSAPFVNMHWGWSPDFRGEGIVPALAKCGAGGLGVTVHLLSKRIDGGDILFRARPLIDAYDNFYSIGLKLAILGGQLFERAIEVFSSAGLLVGEKQNLAIGQLYDGKYMKQHPELYHMAWKNLKREKERVQNAIHVGA